VLRRNQPSSQQGSLVLYLKGVTLRDMESVLNFMYHGEVNVAEDDLNSFLAVAEELQVKGLTKSTTPRRRSTDPGPGPPPGPPAPKRPKSQHHDQSIKEEPAQAGVMVTEDAVQLNMKVEGEAAGEEEQSDTEEDKWRYRQSESGAYTYLEDHIRAQPDAEAAPGFHCLHCSFGHKQKRDVGRHIEEVHSQFSRGYSCSQCGKGFRSCRALLQHMKRKQCATQQDWQTPAEPEANNIFTVL
jgi:hypothetical protein